MRENIVVSGRGQVTLPAGLRKRLGIKPGSVVSVEERSGEIILRPAAVVEIDLYSDKQIQELDVNDRFREGEKDETKKRMANSNS